MSTKRVGEDADIIQLPGTQSASMRGDLEGRVEEIERWIVEVWRDPQALLERALEIVAR